MNRIRTCADLLVAALEEQGCRDLFGVPGDTGVGFYDALSRSTHILHHIVNDERGAAFAADAYARYTGRCGFLEVSSGGGAAFSVGGLAESFAASVPILVIASDIHSASMGTNALTETDQVALFAGVSKRVFSVRSAVALPGIVREASALARSGRPGPVVVSIPEDVLDVEVDPVPRLEPTSAETRGEGAASLDSLIRKSVKLIDDSLFPVLLAGGGAHSGSCYSDLATLANRSGILVGTSIHGKGCFDESSPLSIGVCGANGAPEYVSEVLDKADLFVLVGTRANATDTDGFRWPTKDHQRIVRIDVDAERARSVFSNAIPLIGSAEEILSALADRVAANCARRARLQSDMERVRERWNRSLHGPDVGIVEEVVTRLSHEFGDDVIVVGDPGTATPYLASHWKQSVPGRRVIIPRGHGPMGYALPASIGAAAASDASRLIIFTSDGSTLMAAGALNFMQDLPNPIAIIQFNNESLGWIQTLQDLYLGSNHFSTDLKAFDSVSLATAFGFKPFELDSRDGIDGLVAHIMSFDRLFANVPVPSLTKLQPPVSPWLRKMRQPASDREAY